MTPALLLVGGLFALVYAPLGILAWRRPLLARFAWRESIRRKGQFGVIVLGLMVASASITASLVAGDSAFQTFASLYNQRLGAVDLTVTAAGGRSFPLEVARQLASDPTITAFADGIQAGVEAPVSVADLDQRRGSSNVLMVGFEPASQRRFGAYILSDGRSDYGDGMIPGDVMLSQGLATALAARAGDRVRVSTGSSDGAALRVYGIATSSGPGSYGSHLAVYMPLTTAQLVTHDQGISVVRIAARGGGTADLSAAKRTAAPLRAAVARVGADPPLAVYEARLVAARQLDEATPAILGPYLGFTTVVVLAAGALIVNLMIGLAEERRTRLAVLRALGLTRGGLVVLSLLEGALYSVAAATAGVAVGVPAGLYLGAQLWNAAVVDPTDQAFAGVSLQPSIKVGTLVVAFAAAALITLGTMAASAYRTSRMAIAEAIRDLPDPASRTRNRWPRTAVLLAGATIGISLLVPNDLRVRFVGGTVLIPVVIALARGRLPDRVRFTAAGLLLTAWSGIMAAEVRFAGDLYESAPVIFMAVAVVSVGLTIAAAANLRLIEAAIGLAGSRAGLLQATLRLPMAYLGRRPVRSGLAISAFALVMTLVSGIAFLTAAPRPEYAVDSAGFDVVMVTSGPNTILLPAALQKQIEAQLELPTRLYHGMVDRQIAPQTIPIYVLPDQAAGEFPVYLSSRDKRFGSNAEVWRALGLEPDLAVDASYGLGATVTLQSASGPLRLRVAAHEGSTVLQGLIVSEGTVRKLETEPAGSTVLIKARPGSDPRALASQIEGTLFDQGVHATSIRDILDQDYTSDRDYVTEFDVLLHFGLVGGVLALTMMGIRAAIERKRVIGILRALGYQPVRVLIGMLSEAATTATIGVATGIAAGLILIVSLPDPQIHLTASLLTPELAAALGRLGIATAIVYGTVLIVTLPIAARVARMAPTDAIRITG